MDTEPHREPLAEIPLLGGRLTPGIVRVGNTVRRRALWQWRVCSCSSGRATEDQDFRFAPRFLGMESRGRKILSYLEGES